MSRFWTWVGYGLLVVAVLASGLGAAHSDTWRHDPFWRTVTWWGLVAFTVYAVVGWWRLAPAAPPPPAVPPAASPERPQAAADRPPLGRLLEPVRRAVRWLFSDRLVHALSDYLEPLLTWLVSYPFFVVPFVFFCAVSWYGLGDGLGFPDIVWDGRHWRLRYFTGLAVGMLFGVLLTIRRLLDHRPGSQPSTFFGRRPSLYWFVGRTPGPDKVRQMGAFLFWLWPLTLAAFYVPGLFTKAGQPHLPADNGAMALGLATAVAANLALVWAYDRALRHERVAKAVYAVVEFFPGFHKNSDRRIPDADRDLHGLMGVLSVSPAVFLLLFAVEYYGFTASWSPAWLLCLLIGLFTFAYGFVTFHLGGLQYVLAVLFGLALVVCNRQNPYRMSFPGLESYGPGETPNKLVDPDHPGRSRDGPDREREWADRYVALDLLKTDAVLGTFHDRWAGVPRTDPAWKGRKPKLVIVACTGGGIQAAVWAAAVFEGLERKLPAGPGAAAFRDHIRLLTGASGGMLANALYAASFDDPDKRPGDACRAECRMSTQLARDGLWPTVQTLLINDLPGAAVPWPLRGDRGRRLEEAWEFNTHPWKDDNGLCVPRPLAWQRPADVTIDSPLQKTFADLKAGEANCTRPSVIFAPMLVEDCRRLLITNLDMAWFTTADGSNLNQPLADTPPELLSRPAVEFWTLFPHAYGTPGGRDGFKVGTAARMAATFPFVGPAVSLPTDPPRRVVDAGYFDNFGINLAALWLHRHKKAVLEHTSGVAIVEVRAYPRRKEKLFFSPERVPDDTRTGDPQRKEDLLSWGLSELSTPAEAVINLYSRGAYFRNDQLLDVLDKEFNPGTTDPLGAAAGGIPAGQPVNQFFTTVLFECDQPAALSWTLPANELKAIRGQLEEAAHQEQIKRLGGWFKGGGTR